MTEALDRSYAELLAKIELFVGVDRVALAQLAAYLESLTLSDGVTLCHKGDEGDALYILAEGILEVVIPGEDDKGETRLNVLTTGDYLGEMALITGEPRSATVRARGHTRVLRLARERFLHLLETEPSVGRSVIRVLSQRLRASDRARQQSDLAFKGTVEGVLAVFPSDERARLLLTSVLASRSGAVLEAVFGDRSQEVAANLARLAVGLPEPSPACLQILRERLDQEVAAEEIEGFLSSAGAQLAGACLWNDALSVLAQSGDRSAFVAALGSALRAVPPVDHDTARQWTEQLTDREAATEPLVALLAAQRYEERGQRVAALRVLQQAVEAALAVGDAGAVHKLTEALSGLRCPAVNAGITRTSSVRRLRTSSETTSAGRG
jgi:CRP-like cAMP-binding protein